MAVDEENTPGIGGREEAGGERPDGPSGRIFSTWAERHRVDLMLDAGTFVTSAVLLLGATAYFIGWMWLSAFLDAFGAQWMTINLPATIYLELSFRPLEVVVGVAAIYLLTRRRADPPARREWFIALAGTIATAALFLGAPHAHAELGGQRGLALDLAAWAAFALTEIVLVSNAERHYRQHAKDWRLWGVTSVAAFLVGAYLLPMLEGQRTGIQMTDPRTSTLPRVAFANSDPGDWRLILVVGSQAYVANLKRPLSAKPTLRIVETSQVTGIRGP